MHLIVSFCSADGLQLVLSLLELSEFPPMCPDSDSAFGTQENRGGAW
jgi:hypothetical protein